MRLLLAGACSLVVALFVALAPEQAWAQETPVPVETATPTETPQEAATLDTIGLSQDDVPPGFVPVPLFFLRYANWDVPGDSAWHEFSLGDDYITSTVADVFAPERAWQVFPSVLAPGGGYDERWMDPPDVGDEAALFHLTEDTLPGKQPGFEVKWRRGRYLGRVTVLGISDKPDFAVSLAQTVDARMQAADPGLMEPLPETDIEEVMRQAHEIRGLEARGRVDFSIVAPGVFSSLSSAIGAQLPPLEVGLLTLLGQEADARALANASVGEGGAYTPGTNSIRLFSNGWPLGWKEKLVLAHESTHMVEDQHFGLLSMLSFATTDIQQINSDVAMSVLALAEGDADHTAHLWTDQYLGPDAWNALLADEEQIYAEAKIPALWKAQFTFPYHDGERFVHGFYLDGGWAEVNMLYSRPPVSSEQVLHPDKYVDNDRPIAVPAPEESGVAIRGWHALRVDTLGEVGLRAMLEPFLGRDRAGSAAAGWGGDSYLLVGLDEQHPKALVINSVWDDQTEANEFYAALADSLDVRFKDEAHRVPVGARKLTWSTAHFQVSAERSGTAVRFAIAPDAGSLADLAPPLK